MEYRKASAAIQGEARTLPGPCYSTEEQFLAEQEKIFSRRWLCVGREEQLPDPGDFLNVTLGDESLLVVRRPDGEVGAFYNVCRHRGARLCTAEQGHFGHSIQCPYHAWTYGLDGALLSARHMQDVAGFDRADYPLHRVAAATWEGFVFLNLAPEPEPFEQAFAPLLGRWPAWGMADLRVGHRITYEVAANWKLLFENYSECYHCALVHPALVQLTPPTSGRNDLLEGPFLGGYMTLKPHAESMTTSGGRARPALAGVVGEELSRVYFYSLFPSMLLSLHPDYVLAHILQPLAARRTRVVCEWLFAPEEIGRPGFDPGDAVEFWDMTNRQDWHVCELAQLGVSSRAYAPGPFSHQEGLLDAFDRHYRESMNGHGGGPHP